MRESGRYTFLAALGIDVFVPRYALPGAKASPQRCFSNPAVSEPAVSPESAAGDDKPITPGSGHGRSGLPATRLAAEASRSSVPGNIGARLKESLAEGQSGIGPTTDLPNKPDEHQRTSSVAALPAFRLAVGVATPDVLFISDVSVDAPTNQRVQLLEAIRFAIGSCGERRMDFTFFRWPIIKSALTADDEWSAAREALGAFLERQLDTFRPETLVVFGELAACLLLTGQNEMLNADDWQAMLGKVVSLPGVPGGVLPTHGVDTLLTRPQLKRETWQHLLSRPGLVRHLR